MAGRKRKHKLYVCKIALIRDGTSEYPPSGTSLCLNPVHASAPSCAHLKPHRYNKSTGMTLCTGHCLGLDDYGIPRRGGVCGRVHEEG